MEIGGTYRLHPLERNWQRCYLCKFVDTEGGWQGLGL